jgi:hypothetical protein
MVYNTTQHPRPPTATHCLYCAFTLGRGRGGQREGRGATVHKYSSSVQWGQQFTSWVENTNHESIKSVKHMPQCPLTGQF